MRKGNRYSVFPLLYVLLVLTSALACGTPITTIPAPSPQDSTRQSTASPDVPTDAVEAQVAKVADGVTIYVSTERSSFKIRYIGISIPETANPPLTAASIASEATAKNRELVEGKKVRLEKDAADTDKDGNFLRYVWVGNTMVNAELIRLGYAQVDISPPYVKHQDLLLKLQSEARDKGLGIWAKSASQQPTVEQIQTAKMEREVLELVNKERVGRKATALAWDEELHGIAREHSQEMASRGGIFHSPADKPYAENTAAGIPTPTCKFTAADIVNLWMNSPHHRTWLLCPSLRHIGVGIINSDKGTYASWTFWRKETVPSDWWYMNENNPQPDWMR